MRKMKKIIFCLVLLFITGCAATKEITKEISQKITSEISQDITPEITSDISLEISPATAPIIEATPVTLPVISPTPLPFVVIPTPTPTPTPTPIPTPRPEPVAVLSTYDPYQGQVMGFTLLYPSPEAAYELTDSHFTEPVIPFLHDGKQVALIPVTTSTEVGLHTLSVVEIINGERKTLIDLFYNVQKSDFTRQDLTVSSATSALLTNENLRSDRAKIATAKETTYPTPLWDGVFIQPLEGRITTQFGQMRYTNGSYTNRHDALDIAAPQGTPVVAAATGRVVLADELFVSGKAVIIDHGMWLFTHYYHLHEIGVKVGDEVKAGDFIGEVGSTGYSTGPHLHYAAMIKSNSVNPDMLKEEKLLE